MRDPSIDRRALVLVASGLALGAAGLGVLCFATFQIQSSVGSTLGSGSVTLTFTGQPWNPLSAVFLAWLMAIPLVLLFFPWRFYLATLVAPVYVALLVGQWIDSLQTLGAVVVASSGWAIAGVALVFAGCLAEALGIVSRRKSRVKSTVVRIPRNRQSPSVVAPPR